MKLDWTAHSHVAMHNPTECWWRGEGANTIAGPVI